MRFSLFAVGVLISTASALAAPVCPTTSGQSGTDSSGTGCSVLFTYVSTGTYSIKTTGLGPYDAQEDVTVGLINNSASSLASLSLSSAAGTNAFGFESDGIQTFASTNGVAIATGGATGYEGPGMTFDTSGVTNGDGTLVINFSPEVAAGGSTYFSLEGTPLIGTGITIIGSVPGGGTGGTTGGGTTGGGTTGGGTTGGTTGGGTTAAPEPASFAIMGSGGLALGLLALRRRR